MKLLKPKIGIVDADSIMFNIGWWLAKAEMIDDIDYSHATEAPEVIYKAVDSALRKIRTAMGVDVLHLHFTASGKNQKLFEEFYKRPMRAQFRTELGCTYKANRSATPLPCGYHLTLRVLLEQRFAYMHDMWEADDAVILAKKLMPDAVLSSNDKDVWKQHYGSTYHYDKRAKDPKKAWGAADLGLANSFAFTQAVTGDPVDGFGGAYKIGETKCSVSTTKTPKENWEAVLQAYRDSPHDYGTEAELLKEALVNMRMASMQQLAVDPKTGKVFIDLWKPEGRHLEPVWSLQNESI